MRKDSWIFVAGHKGLAGSALVRALTAQGCTGFDELVREMVREDLKDAKRDELVKKHGYSVCDHNE